MPRSPRCGDSLGHVPARCSAPPSRPFDIPIGVIILGAGAYYVYRHVQHVRASNAVAVEEH